MCVGHETCKQLLCGRNGLIKTLGGIFDMGTFNYRNEGK